MNRVEANLRSGRLRLVLVADVISRELRRIIEFSTEQMTQTEVIGVEIRRYVDPGGKHQTRVPRLIGQTEAARDIKSPGSTAPRRRWDRERWLSEFERKRGPTELEAVHRLPVWAEPRGLVGL